MTKLKQYLQQFGTVAEKDWEFFASRLHQHAFRKKQRILQAGRIEDHVSFIERGIIRYFVEEDDKDITFEIAFENSFASAYDSFLTRTPVRYHAEALTDTVVWSIHYTDLQEMYAATAGNRIGRLAAEALYVRKSRRQLSFLKDSATQRYTDMVRDHPHLLQHVPLKYLASYIGITPQALSRIRRRIS